MKKIRLGSRASKLALAQAGIVQKALHDHHPDLLVEIVPIQTTGDILYNKNLALIGGKGLFLKEIETALLRREIDIAVHAMKDVPAFISKDLAFCAILQREDPRDVLISRLGHNLANLPEKAVIGTCAGRRNIQLLAMRPDLQIIPMRGNIDTRINKLHAQGLDAIVLANAGLLRLGLTHDISEIFSIDKMVPAPAQGAIGIQHRAEDHAIATIMQPLNHHHTAIMIGIERDFMQCMNGDCTTPIGAYAEHDLNSDIVTLHTVYAPQVEVTLQKKSASLPYTQYGNLGRYLAETYAAI